MPKITKAGGATNAATYPVGILSAPQVEVTVDRPRDLDRPPRSANKAAWFAYTESIGHIAEGLTRKQMIALVGKS